MLLQKLKGDNQGIPPVLIHNKPYPHHSEEQLSYAAANLYHNMKNTDKMMFALSRLPKLEDQTNFLVKRNYIQEAANLLESNGQYEKASDLYLTRGMTAEALECARKTNKKVLIGNALLTDSFIRVHKYNEHTDEETKEKICDNLETAFNIFQNQNLKDEAGMASLLRGQITGNRIIINKAFGAFSKAEPLNEAGQLECMDWMMDNSTLHEDSPKVMRQVILGMDNLFGILRVLIKQSNHEEKQRAEKILMFYGLKVSEDGQCIVLCPRQYPMAVKMMKRLMSSKDRKEARCEIAKDVALAELCSFLVERGYGWMTKIEKALYKIRTTMKQCPDFTLGRTCSQMKIEDAEDLQKSSKCPYLHEFYSQFQHNQLLDTDEWLIELSYYVQHGSQVLMKIGNANISKVLGLERFLPSDVTKRYQTCLLFLQDLLPDSGFLTVATDTPLKAKDLKLWFNNKKRWWFREYFKQYLIESFEEMKKMERKWNNRVFVRLIFLSRLLNLKLSKKPIIFMTEFEMEVCKELKMKTNENVVKFIRETKSLGFIPDVYEIQGKPPSFGVMCMSHRFYDAIEKLSGPNNDPGEALIQFSKFVSMLSTHKDYVTVMPFYGDFIFWLEFFVTVSFSLIAKTYSGDSFFFVLPESYVSEIYLVDASHTQVPTLEAVQRFRSFWNLKKNEHFMIRLRNLTCILSGERTMNMLEDLFKIKEEDKTIGEERFGMAERVLVLTLVCLCNIGHGLLPDREVLLMQQLHRIRPNKSFPQRLMNAIEAIQKSTGQQDLAQILTELLRKRGNEKLLFCMWTNQRYGLSHKILDITAMNKDFFNEETMTCSSGLLMDSGETRQKQEEEHVDNSEEIQEDLGITMEERMKREIQQREIDNREKDHNASCCISKFFRNFVIKKRCAKLTKFLKKEIEKEETLRKVIIFQSVEITEDCCGICGESFKPVEEEKRDAVSQSGELSKNTEQTKPKSFLDYFLPTFQSLGSSSSEHGDDSQEEKYRRHLSSASHNDQVRAQQFFRWKFMKEISKDFFDISDFIDKFKLASKSHEFEGHSFLIERMVRLQKEAEEELKRIVKECDWTQNQTLLEKVKEMKSDYAQVHNYVKEQAKLHKKNLEEKHAAAKEMSRERYSPESWEDEIEEVGEVVDDPKLRKPKSGKGRGRGRGKRRDK